MTPQATTHVQPPLLAATLGLTAVLLVAVSAEPVPTPVVAVAGALRPAAVVEAPSQAPVPPLPDGAVRVSVPAGVLAITTPYTAAMPLVLTVTSSAGGAATTAPFGSSTDIAHGVKIVDTRPAEFGFVAQVSTDQPDGARRAGAGRAQAGLVGVEAVQVQGNGLRSTDVHATDVPPDGPLGGQGQDAQGGAAPRTVASYAAGLGIGTAWLAGTVELAGGDRTDGGADTLTLTFTVF